MYSDFLSAAIRAARGAGEIIMDYYEKGVEVKQKANRSYVTIADQEAEKLIIEEIKKEFPEHGFFGEESGRQATEKEYVWAIDPIDGTNNFVHRIPYFATQIALMKGKEIIMGLSYAPLLKELMYAEKGQGAFLNGDPVKVSQTKDLDQVYLCFGGPKHFAKKQLVYNLIKVATDVNSARGFGDF